MGGRKLILWIFLGLSLLIMASAKRSQYGEEEEEDFEDEDDECDPNCERKCHKLRCASGFVRDRCGCCECKLAEGGTKPKIVSSPVSTRNYTGNSAALSCEIIGDPIPFVSWLMTNVNNNTIELPGDDRNMMTVTQGGPEKHEVTAWLQIMKLRKEHEGDYSCVAFNKHGTVKDTARLKVQKIRKNRHHHHRKE